MVRRRGTIVQFSLANANRDEEHYTQSDSFIPNRSEKGLLSFGAGEHSCLGYSLAKKELEIVLRILLDRLKNFHVRNNGTFPIIQGRIFRRPDTLNLNFQKR